jgi:hypothetical protein
MPPKECVLWAAFFAETLCALRGDALRALRRQKQALKRFENHNWVFFIFVK